MKCVLTSTTLSLFFFASLAQKTAPVDTKITEVTVFLSKAQVTRTLSSSVEKGKTELVVGGLSSRLDPESIQVAGKGAVVILGISHRQNYLNEFEMPASLRMLQDSLEYFQKQLTLEQSKREILNKEEQMLISNQEIGGTNQNLTVSELKAMADFYRSRLGDIAMEKIKQDDKIEKANESIAQLKKQINAQNELNKRNTSEIVITLAAEAPSPVDLTVSYVVNDAGWQPVYDQIGRAHV